MKQETKDKLKKALKVGGAVAVGLGAGHLGGHLNSEHYKDDMEHYNIGRREEAKELESGHQKIVDAHDREGDRLSQYGSQEQIDAHNKKGNEINSRIESEVGHFNRESDNVAKDKYDSYKTRHRAIGLTGLTGAILGGRHVAKSHDANKKK